MLVIFLIVSVVFSVTSVSITEPEHYEEYNLDELPAFRAIVENDNVIPDSVHYSLNDETAVFVSRLSTDWPTYMQSYLHHGFSESPAPVDNTILWTAPVTGDSHEFPTPVVVEGIVYYPSNLGTDSLYALDAATGELIWKYHVGYTDDAVTISDGYVYTASDSIWCLDALSGDRIWASGEADANGSTPVVLDGKVFCGTAYHTSPYPDTSWVVCLDADNGNLIWSRTLPDVYTVSCLTPWNDLLLVPTSSLLWGGTTLAPLYALDIATGSTVWENNDAEGGYWDSSPVVVDNVMYIAGCDGKARGIELTTGSTVWEIVVSTLNGHPSATLAFSNNRLYFANQDSEDQAFYYCLDAAAGSVVWAQPERSQHGSSAVADGLIFYGDNINAPDYGMIRAIDCESGNEVWSFIAENSAWIAGSPSVVDGVVYMPMHDWNLYAFGTGLKYTYTAGQLNSVLGWNELVATSFIGGEAVASDTISYYINQTGIEINPSLQFGLQGSPNPFSSSVSLSFTLVEAGLVSLAVYDLSGRKVADLIQEPLSSGSHTVHWDGIWGNGQAISSGLYQCRIQCEGTVETTGLCVLR